MIGEQIKSLRIAKNITQVQLAQKLGVTKQSVSNWENNNNLPSVDIVKKIAFYFGCTTDYLLEMNSERVTIETVNLTLEQTMHIQQLVRDFELLNNQITENSKKA